MTKNHNTQGQGIQVIARAAAILRVLKDDNEGLSLGQIAERTSLARSTVQRIVNALISEQLVVSGVEGGGVRLGPEIQAMAAATRQDLSEQIRPILMKLSETTGETVDLASFRKDHMIFIDQIVGPHRLRAVATIGEMFPMTSTANGKACLALMNDEKVEEIALHELRSSGRGIRKMGQFMKEIAEIRKNGFAFDLEEQTDGISAVGIGFQDEFGQFYAVSTPVPSYRFEKKKSLILESLEAIKKDLSLNL